MPRMDASRIAVALVGCSLAALTACSSDDTASSTGTTSSTTGAGGGGTGGGGGAGGGAAPACTDPTAVPCSDEVLLDMNLQSVPAPGLVSSTADGAGWTSMIDATAGGAFATTPDSYVYAKFTATGLEKVAISDEESLDSMDWDIAFRRYVVRINSGHSGPSCVTAARVPPGPTYESVTSVPDGLTFHKDEYFTDSCELIADGTGLPGSPATALSSYWTYPGCVQMTYNVYVVELASGEHLKLTVDRYYDETNQAECQATGAVPMGNTGAANFVVRWAMLP